MVTLAPPVDVVSKSFQKVVPVAETFENTMQPVIGLYFHSSASKDVDHEASWVVLLNEVHAPTCSMIDCDESFIERALVDRRVLHVCIPEEEWKIVYQNIIDGKENETKCTNKLPGLSLEIEVCNGMCEADSDCTRPSLDQERQTCLSSRSSPPGSWLKHQLWWSGLLFCCH